MPRTFGKLILPLAILTALPLGGCSLIGGAKAKAFGGDKAKMPDAPGGGGGGAPAVAASDDDPQEVTYMIRGLEELDGMAQSGDNPRFPAVSDRIGNELFVKPEDALRKHKKYGALKSRYLGIKLAFAKTAGPRAVEIMGDATVVTEVNEDAGEAIDQAFRACESLQRISNSEEQVPIYEEKLARAKKIDAKSMRAKGHDVKFAICELTLAARKVDFEDTYRPEQVDGKTETACGKKTFMVRALQIGSNKFGNFERVAGGTSYAEKVSCGKIPKKDKYSSAFTDGVKEHMGREGTGVVVWDGKFRFETDQEDFRVYKYADLTHFSNAMEFSANPCGGDDKLACEPGGSKTVGFFNRLQFGLARADVQRKAGRVDRCKEHLKSSVKLAEELNEFYESAKRSGSWRVGLKYKVRGGEIFTEAQIIAKAKELGTKADEQKIGGWCEKK